MAVTYNARSIIMTAANDTVTQAVKVLSIRLIGTGMTPGQRLTLRSRTVSGPIICDHYVVGANEDQVLFSATECGAWVDRPFLAAVPAAGTFTLVIQTV